MSDLAAFHWETNSMKADFIIPNDDSRLLRVEFDNQTIVRILDEMPLSTEDDGPWVGLIPEHFAYRVDGSAFLAIQSQAWREVVGNPSHYRFITGWACLDVISSASPKFDLIDRPIGS
ncbi:hypothetical protein [Sphingomonas abietis]|uniref:Integron Cassette Protein Hfx-Cass5 domain-containing protein n=1 Tax=Sphingomonas abietis TaxID=3012344 RepID=A0ABY7NSG4_9SPHN|nr:hypothetical protein [Sphingomonas abietis]WBO23512.1 hypothetical protein PBT88_05125 [Sphingomonas abietis]